MEAGSRFNIVGYVDCISKQADMIWVSGDGFRIPVYVPDQLRGKAEKCLHNTIVCSGFIKCMASMKVSDGKFVRTEDYSRISKVSFVMDCGEVICHYDAIDEAITTAERPAADGRFLP